MIVVNFICVTLGILLQLLVEVKSQVTSFRRSSHTATLIKDKIYILGGSLPNNIDTAPVGSFLYLDVSVPFNTDQLNWIDLSNVNIIPPHRFAASVRGGANNDTLFLYGGGSLENEPMALVYSFDTQT